MAVLCGCHGPTPRDVRLPNFAQVEHGLYRGGEPNAAGLGVLRTLGVRWIIDLRATPSTQQAEQCRLLGLAYYNVPMAGTGWPETGSVLSFLSIYGSARVRGVAVYVHCSYGSDRTGVCVAAHRVVDEQWIPAYALKEAREYNLSPLLPKYQEFILGLPGSLGNRPLSPAR